jgi:hypothetical protein
MYHLPALEEAAAERSVRYDIHRLPELVFSLMGFSSFSRLSEFHARRQGHYQDALNSIVMDPKVLESQCFQTGGICCIAPWSHLRTKLAWPRVADKDGSKKPPEPADVLRKVITEIGQIGGCSVWSSLPLALILRSHRLRHLRACALRGRAAGADGARDHAALRQRRGGELLSWTSPNQATLDVATPPSAPCPSRAPVPVL